MYDIFVPGGVILGYGCCSYGNETPRNFLTKEEKIEMLKEYKESLEKEAQGVAERIKELEKRN
jgi:predicted metal-binding protein